MGRWQERDLRLKAELPIGVDGKAKTLSHGWEDDRSLHKGKRIPDTKPLTTAKREICVLRKTLCETSFPALRDELIWFVEELRVPMIDPLTDEDRVAGFHSIARKLKFGRCFGLLP